MGALSVLTSAAEGFPIQKRRIEGVDSALVRISGAPGVGIVFGLREGPAFEPEDWWGISHFAATLAAAGTGAFPSAFAVRGAVESAGGSFSTVNRRDLGGFQVKVPAGYERRALEVLTEVLTRPAIEEERVRAVRKDLIAERDSELEDPAQAAKVLLEGLLLAPSPASRHPGGGDEFVEAADRILLSDYIRGVYHRGNLSVGVVGGFSDAFEASLAATLAAFPEGLGRRIPDFEVGDIAGGRKEVRVVTACQETACISLGWNVPLDDLETELSLCLIRTLLGSGKNALLRSRVKEAAGARWRCGTELSYCGDSGLLRVDLEGPAGGMAKALRAVEGTISDLASGRVGPDLLRDAATRAAAERLFSFEEPLQAAESLCGALGRDGAVRPLVQELEALEKLPPESASRLVSTRMTPEKRRLVVLSGAKAAEAALPEAALLGRVRGGRSALI